MNGYWRRHRTKRYLFCWFILSRKCLFITFFQLILTYIVETMWNLWIDRAHEHKNRPLYLNVCIYAHVYIRSMILNNNYYALICSFYFNECSHPTLCRCLLVTLWFNIKLMIIFCENQYLKITVICTSSCV